MREPAKEPLVVLGAGMTGLSACHAAAEAGSPVTVLECRSELGGMAATRYRGNLEIHAGVHLLHPSTNALIPVVREMSRRLGDQLVLVTPRSSIHFRGRLMPFPLQFAKLFPELGSMTTLGILASAARSRLDGMTDPLRRGSRPDTFETVVSKAYGRRLYELFFRDYTQKVLGIPPGEISGEWARLRVPSPSALSFLRALVGLSPGDSVDHSFFPENRQQATGTGGLTRLFQELASSGGDLVDIRTGCRVRSVDVSGGTIRSVQWIQPDGTMTTRSSSLLVSTIPLTDLVGMLSPRPPEEVLRAAEQLRFRGILFVFLHLRRPSVLQDHWVYFQSPDTVFNRASEFARLVPSSAAGKDCLVCLEVTADGCSDHWRAAVAQRAFQDLKTVVDGLRDDELLDTYTEWEPFAYPRWHAGFETQRRVVKDYLGGIRGLVSTGRQGRFDYLNLDQCYELGRRETLQLIRQTSL
jgi:protoporphyrinogen oxidase